MEKAVNYPPMSNSSNPNHGIGFVDPTQMHTAPPSYDQATGSNVGASNATAAPQMHTTYTFTGNNNNGTTQQPQPSYPTQQQYAGDGGMPPYHNRTYMTQQQQVPMVQQPMVIIQQQTILPLGPDPTFITCPACHIQKLTRIEFEPSSRTHLMAALLCILGLWCCVCLPYCAGSCMNTNHYCGNCNKFLGTYGGGGF